MEPKVYHPRSAYEICRNIMEAQVPIDQVYVAR